MPNLTHIGDITSEMIGTRVIPFEGNNPLTANTLFEHSFRGAGILLGEDFIQSFTGKSIFHEGDSALSNLQNPFSKNGFYETRNSGVLISVKSGDRVTWTGHGMGIQTNPLPGSEHTGVRFYKTESVNLIKFNGLIAVVELIIPPSGKGIKEHHWKVV